MKKDFDFKKYVVSNKATLGSKLESMKTKKLLKEETEEDEFDSSAFEKEPTAKDIKKVSSSTSGNYKKRTQLAQLTKQKDDLLKKLKAGQLTIDQYKQQIGSIPQQIKTLTADLKRMPGFDDEVEPDLDEIEGYDNALGEELQKWSPFKRIPGVQKWNPFKRMEDISKTDSLNKLHSVLEVLVSDWLKDGYEKKDIIEYLEFVVDTYENGSLEPLTELGGSIRSFQVAMMKKRMEEIVNQEALKSLHRAMNILVTEWLDDGFLEDDIKDYMIELIRRNV